MSARIRGGVAGLVAGLLLPAAVTAQISPGPLSRAHEDLEGVTKCLQCHGIGENVVDDKCLACHQAIEWLRDRGRGLHGLEGGTDCKRCHLEHGGRDFEIIHWEDGELDAFDHDRAGYVLDGAHAKVECRECHQVKYHAGPVPTLDEHRLAMDSWLGLEAECLSCHRDPHEARLGNTCVECHTTVSWADQPPQFDHDRTRYPLEGAHATVECKACHQAGYLPEHMPAFARCADCHADPHSGKALLAGAAVDCEDCHGLAAFRPSTYTVARHQESSYPLEGGHAPVACEECHGQGRTVDADGTIAAQFRFRPAFAKCMDCHDDPHGGQLRTREDRGACETCHRVDAFRPSLFTVADHQKLEFPLEGRHEEVSCRDCHGPERPHLPATPPADVIGKARVQLRFDTLKCLECHRDPHQGRFVAGTERGGQDGCVTCHQFGSFSATKVDVDAHRAYRFPLDGAHAAVPCFDCHGEMHRERSPSLLLAPATTLTFEHQARTCVECHDDPHGGQFAVRADGGACDVCHDAQVFEPASLFDHDTQARFPLDGAHEQVACDKCHPVGARPDGTDGIIYRPIIPHRCEDCHSTPPPPLRKDGS